MTKEERNIRLNKIFEIYKENKISLTTLSKQYKISISTISNFLKSKGLSIKRINNKSNLNKAVDELKINNIEEVSKTEYKKQVIALAIQEYLNTAIYDRSIVSIAAKYGINRKTLTKYLKINNIEIVANRNKSEFNKDFFDVIDTEEKAYWLGFMYANGCVCAKKFTVSLNISLKDIEHLKKYNKALNYKKGLNITETYQFGSKEHTDKNGDTMYMVSTQITNEQLWNSLISKGCVPNKSLILTFPPDNIFKNRQLIYDFIRGYVDGNGSLGVYPHSKKNPKLEESLLIVGTKNFLEGVQKYLGKGFLMQKTNCNKNTYRLSYSTSKAHRAADLLYKNATIYLDRKYNIYINKFAALKLGKIGEPCDGNTEVN